VLVFMLAGNQRQQQQPASDLYVLLSHSCTVFAMAAGKDMRVTMMAQRPAVW
jgi:hypothetical protein